MEATHRIAEQTRFWSRFAKVSVTVEPSAVHEVLVASDAHRDNNWRREALLELVTARFDELVGRELVDVTESRHWFDGRRDRDAQSLIHVWLRFEEGAPIRLHGLGDTLEISVGGPHESCDTGPTTSSHRRRLP